MRTEEETSCSGGEKRRDIKEEWSTEKETGE